MAFNASIDFINTEERQSGRYGFTLVQEVHFVEVEDDFDNMMKGV